MSKIGSGKVKMSSVRAKRQRNTMASLHKTRKALSTGSRAWVRGMKKVGKSSGKKKGPVTAHRRAAPAPLTPAAAKIRRIGIAVVVLGALLSLALAPLGAVIIVAGIVGIVGSRKIAERREGRSESCVAGDGDASHGE